MSRYFPPAPESWNDRNPPPSNAQLLKLLGIFGLILALIIWSGLTLVNHLVWLIPPQVEQQLGAIARPIYERQAEPSPTQDTLNQLLDRLEQHLPPEQHPRDYQVLYIPKDTVNALAIPGDRIIIFRGLLAEVTSENELMMVLGHELGHFVNRDHLRGIVWRLVLPVAIATLFGDASGLVGAGATVAETLSGTQFSQRQELQADQVGLSLLQDTYGHVGGATDFFVRLSQSQTVNIDFLSTHPLPQKRIQALERIIDQQRFPTEPPMPLAPSLQATKAFTMRMVYSRGRKL
ncbi:MAG: M48 family metallopeptidase [Cyanothece sp. SIO1E1]|nr:M48 family metallopeptidase [Cyanothece sp. SIO1E1]